MSFREKLGEAFIEVPVDDKQWEGFVGQMKGQFRDLSSDAQEFGEILTTTLTVPVVSGLAIAMTEFLSFEKVVESVKKTVIGLGGAIVNRMSIASDSISEVIDVAVIPLRRAFEGISTIFSEEMERVGASAQEVAIGIGVLLAVIGPLALAFSKVVFWMGEFFDTASSVAKIVFNLGRFLSIFTTILWGITAAAAAVLSSLATLIGLMGATTAIIVLALATFGEWEQVLQLVDEALSILGGTSVSVFGTLGRWIDTVVEKFTSLIGISEGALAQFIGVTLVIGAMVSGLVTLVSALVTSNAVWLVTTAITKAYTAAMWAATTATGAFIATWILLPALALAVGIAIGRVIDEFNLFEKQAKLIDSLIRQVIPGWPDVFETATKAIKTALQEVLNFLARLWVDPDATIKQAGQAIADFANKAEKKFQQFTRLAIKKLQNWGPKVVSTVSNAVQDMIDWIEKLPEKGIRAIQEWTTESKNAISSWAESVVFGSIIPDAIDAILSELDKLTGAGIDKLKEFAKEGGIPLEKLKNNAKEILKGMDGLVGEDLEATKQNFIAKLEEMAEGSRLPLNKIKKLYQDMVDFIGGKTTAMERFLKDYKRAVDRAVKGVSDAFAEMAVNAEFSLEKIEKVLDQLTKQILSSGIQQFLIGDSANALVPNQKGGGGGGEGFQGAISMFLNALSSGGGSNAGGTKTVQPQTAAGGARALGPQQRADGGPVQKGQATVVGEEGMEMFVPQQNGTVIPNDFVGAGGAGKGAVEIRIKDESGDNVEVSEKGEGNGVNVVDLMVKATAQSVREGGGVAQAIKDTFGVSRVGGRGTQ